LLVVPLEQLRNLYERLGLRIRCEGSALGQLRFGLGLRDGRVPLVESTSGDWVAVVAGQVISITNARG